GQAHRDADEGPSHGRLGHPREAHARQPHRVADRGRGDRHHRGEGEAAPSGGREDHHEGQEGRRPQPPPGRLLPGRQGHGAQALRGDRPPLRHPQRRLHPDPQARAPPRRQRADGPHRARL
ncbi:MAG: LSU ribosomal protein L17p, partial [uncultured Acidimicrobiales bacterium]